MKILFTFTLSVISFYTLFSQPGVQGLLLDQQRQPLPYATVMLLKQSDSTLVKGAITDISGKFLIENISQGDFILRAQSVGHISRDVSIPLKENNFISVEDIILTETTYNLKEVIVSAERPMFDQQVDKLVVNVERSLVSAGGSVLDVLERSPGVAVNRQNGSLGMNGKQGVLVMIDGKMQRMPLNMVVSQLEGVSASQVDKIEIITNPSARYDAEGDAGIINIISKKSKTFGTNGTATFGIGYGTYSSYWKPTGSINLYHKRESLSLYATYSNNSDRRWQQWNYERQVHSPSQYSMTISDRYVRWPIQRATFGAEWSMTPKTSVNGLITGFSNLWKMEAYNTSNISQNNKDSATVNLYDKETNHWKHALASINFMHHLSDLTSIRMDADYLYYYDENPNDFINNYDYHQTGVTYQELVRSRKQTPVHMQVYKIDYTKTLNNLSIESGVKASFSRLQNTVSLERYIDDVWQADPGFTQNYLLKDDALATYMNISGKIGDNKQFQLGLRAEYTDMNMQARNDKLFSMQFWSLFPTFYYSNKINDKRSWQISYGRRISRPGYNDVAPFVIFMDPFTYYWGNLSMKPALSDGIQASLSQDNMLFTLRYSYDKNAIVRNQSRFDTESRKTYIYADNVDLQQTFSLAAAIPLPVTRWWNTQNNAIITYQTISHELNEKNLYLEQLSVRINSSHQFTLPRNFSVEITGVYVAPRRIGLSILKQQADIAMSIQKKFTNNAKLSITVNDLFWTTRAYYLANDPSLNQVQETSYINEPRIIRMSYMFFFGKKSVKASQQRKIASDAEQQRFN